MVESRRISNERVSEGDGRKKLEQFWRLGICEEKDTEWSEKNRRGEMKRSELRYDVVILVREFS